MSLPDSSNPQPSLASEPSEAEAAKAPPAASPSEAAHAESTSPSVLEPSPSASSHEPLSHEPSSHEPPPHEPPPHEPPPHAASPNEPSQYEPSPVATSPHHPAPSRAAPADIGPELKQRFPKLFVGAPKPLKLRIQVDIQERAPGIFTKQALSAFFRRYTGSTSYLQAVAHAPHRFDLDGAPAGEISAEHRQVALDELARRRGNQEARRALEFEQRRNRAGLLRDFERTTLTRANFCALKQVADDELDGLLERARREAAEDREMQRRQVPLQRPPDRRGPRPPPKPRA